MDPNEFMARNVMGMVEKYEKCYWVEKPLQRIIEIKDWNPKDNIIQAEECLIRYCKDIDYRWELSGGFFGKNTICKLIPLNNGKEFRGNADKISYAICKAIQAAIKGREKEE